MATHRWFQFSLRGFLVVLAACCLWLGSKANARHREYTATEAIRKLGASCHYGWHRGNWPSWLIEALGNDAYKHPTKVVFRRRPSRVVGAEELRPLADLPYLEEVHFVNLLLTDDAVERLTRLDQLQSVLLSDTTVSSTGKNLLRAYPKTPAVRSATIAN